MFLYLGVTCMIRNNHNPFADPTLASWIFIIVGGAAALKIVLNSVSRRFGLWRLTVDGRIRFDNADANKMDAVHNQKRLIKNVTTNPFRHKFIILNREWVVQNIALILGGRSYVSQAGAELNYLRHVY